ncbi:queuosine precursor transporter [Radiobacillus kanasensis]|uniref:queuosine precursor transporter n=1 Tax=Radiobacillus kanasensis TaxID=2844358 RepID=UPI001E4AFF8F|nr:queuosine precursor transporter [Radiobacillus kanasensis]UFU00289.1 queuosine precursor transporter [Radiobacillus kanasensis]
MLVYLNALFVGLLVLSNILGVKLFSIGNIMLPAAVIVYVVTYLITDVIGEIYGKKAAQQTVNAGFFTQVIGLIFIYLAIQLPSAPVFDQQQAFSTVLGGSFRVMVASLVAYLLSQNLDLLIFHRLKEKHGEKKLWLRNNASTAFSQLIDTTAFITIAFYSTVPNSVLVGMIMSQYAVKLVIALVDTPIAYLLVRIAKKEKQSSNLITN